MHKGHGKSNINPPSVPPLLLWIVFQVSHLWLDYPASGRRNFQFRIRPPKGTKLRSIDLYGFFFNMTFIHLREKEHHYPVNTEMCLNARRLSTLQSTNGTPNPEASRYLHEKQQITKPSSHNLPLSPRGVLSPF